MPTVFINIGYLIASVLFILGLKGLTHPRTAVRGNLLGATGMLLAVILTLINQKIISFEMILLGLVIGGAIGYLASHRPGLSAAKCVTAGILLGPFAVALFFLPSDSSTPQQQRCPYCARQVMARARVCPHCRALLAPGRE